MNEYRKDQDEKIENLDLNDMNLEVKIKPTEVKVENLDFETDSSISNTNTNVENNGFDDAAENLTDEQLSNEAFQDSKASDKMTTGENQDDQSAYDSPLNDQLQQSDDLVESGDQENSFDEGDLKEPEAGEKNNEQSFGENISNGQSSGEAPVNDHTNSENSGGNKESGKSQNDNFENKKNDNNLNNNPENKKDANKDSGEKKNRDNGQNNSDLNNKKDQDTSKTSQDNKKKNENSSPSKSNNNKPEMGNKEKQPSGLNKKRDDLKNKWNNRPKTPKDFANRAKNGIKNRAKNRYNNSGLGKAINNGKKAIQGGKKAAQKTKVAAKAVGAFLKTPAGLVTLGVIVGLLLIMILIIIVPSMFASGSPLVGGEVQEEENYNRYSEVDQKTIEKLKSIAKKYSSGNPSYAMAATLYPYIEEMQNGNVNSIRGKTNTSQSDDEDAYDDSDNSDDSDEKEDLKEDENDSISNDPYLELFRQWKYRRKFTKLLKISKDGDDALTEYLKNTWFKKDAGYKELFDGVTDQEALANAIINDIQDQKDDFNGYFFSDCSTSYSTQSGGQVTIDYSNSDGISLQELMTKNIVVDVKKSSCTETGKLTNCESMYSSPISMKQYAIGVTIQEVSTDLTNIEHIKANMIAEKSYAIGRAFQRGNVSKIDENTYVIGIIDSTRDQDYCDYLTGDSCSDGVKGSYNSYGSNLEQAWTESQNMYLYSGKSLIGSVCQNKSYAKACSCKTGECLFQEEVENGYDTEKADQILYDQFKNKNPEVLTAESGYLSSTITTSSTTCSNETDISNFIYYAQNDYANTAFCGRTLSDGKNGCEKGDSICTSGCGVTSAAMVVATLTQNSSITPETINSSARSGTDCGDSGTYAALFPYVSGNNGLTAKNISGKEEIISTLDAGGLVIANVDGTFGDGIYNTGGGHYVVIRGYSENNVYIADPWQNSKVTKHCEEFDSSNHCTKLSTDFDTFIKNVETHGGSGFYAITGGIPFRDSGSNEILSTGTQNTYFAPVQNVKPSFGSKGSTGGCSDSVYHDISGISEGTKIYAGADGTANFYQIYNSDVGLVSYGNVIELETNDDSTIIYGHLQKFASGIKTKVTKTCPKKGGKPPCPASSYKLTKEKVDSKTVKKGELIGYLGNTGNSTGAHLHVEIRKSGSCVTDPWKEFGMR